MRRTDIEPRIAGRLREAREWLAVHGEVPLGVLARISGSRSKRRSLVKRIVYRIAVATGSTQLRLRRGFVLGLDDPVIGEFITRYAAPSSETAGPEAPVDEIEPDAIARELGLAWGADVPIPLRSAVEALTTLRLAGGFATAALSARVEVVATRVEDAAARAAILGALGSIPSEAEDAEGQVELDEVRRIVWRGEVVEVLALKPEEARRELAAALAARRARGGLMREDEIQGDEAASDASVTAADERDDGEGASREPCARCGRLVGTQPAAKARHAQGCEAREREEASGEATAAKNDTEEEETLVAKRKKTTKCDVCGRLVANRGLVSHMKRHDREGAGEDESEATRGEQDEGRVRGDPLAGIRAALSELPERARRPALELLLALESA